MNRLQTELNRLYLLPNPHPPGHDPAHAESALINADGQVRAMVVEIAQSAGWSGVAAVWHGVQDALDLPAPAIAVSGVNGYQVWFSLAEPVPVAQALDFLASLRQRFMGAIAPKFISLKPFVDDSAVQQVQHARMVPAIQPETGRWSAFVAPGLASMFADEPWLDEPPSPEAQASLLSRCESIKPGDFRLALERLRPAVRETGTTPALASAPTHNSTGPKQFLLAVMNDPATDLHLRIEAAKALLPYF